MKLRTKRTNGGKSRVLLLRREEIPQVSLVYRVDRENKPYLPLCQFWRHQGVVSRGHEICEERVCRHYQRLYREEVRL